MSTYEYCKQKKSKKKNHSAVRTLDRSDSKRSFYHSNHCCTTIFHLETFMYLIIYIKVSTLDNRQQSNCLLIRSYCNRPPVVVLIPNSWNASSSIVRPISINIHPPGPTVQGNSVNIHPHESMIEPISIKSYPRNSVVEPIVYWHLLFHPIVQVIVYCSVLAASTSRPIPINRQSPK